MKKALLAGAAAALVAATLTAQTVQINGAGATFPAPIYSKWFSEYNKLHPNVRINYQPIGSGGGIRQISSQTVFFGATDGPMTNDQLLAAPGRLLHFPTVLGAVVPVYNVPGAGAAEIHRSAARRHLPRQDYPMERSGNREDQFRRQSSCHGYHGGSSVGWQRDLLYFRGLSRQSVAGMETESGGQHVGELAGGCWRERQ